MAARGPADGAAKDGKAGVARSPSRKRPARAAAEPLAELGPVEMASMALHEALHRRHFEKYPTHPAAWASYRGYFRILGWSHAAILGLVVLTIFETPLWCRAANGSYWDYRPAAEKCAEAKAAPGEVLMSGVPLLPLGMSLVVEFILLGIVLCRILLTSKVHNFFRGAGSGYRSDLAMIVDYVVILLGFGDAFYFSFFPTTKVRIAPFVRFGLAATIPWVHDVIASFVRVSKSVFTVGLFAGGTIVVFAWIAAMVFDDLDEKDRYGMPINQGFETFGNALYTMFVTMTTNNVPDVMVPSYVHSRLFLLFWLPFFLLAICIFMRVILAVVYHEYQAQVTERIKRGHRQRIKGISATFDFIKASTKVDKRGKVCHVVHFDTFVQLVKSIRTISTSAGVDEMFMRILFDALDDDKSETLTNKEFHDMCDVLQTTFQVTKRDSWVRTQLEGTECGSILHRLMTNGEEGPDLGACPPSWMRSKYTGSPFDVFIDVVLGLNVAWLLVQSVFDLNDIHTFNWFSSVDLAFSFIYIVEVVVKLCWWSFPEYWMSNDNRFDFFSTGVLAAGGLAVLCLDVRPDIIRYLNLLRLVRLLKALNNIPAYQATEQTISRMVTTCGDVLAMNLLMIYLWSAWGLQLFGGQLVESNPALKGQDLGYFGSHYEVYNFNDMVLSMVTMFFITLSNWNDSIARVCLALSEHYSFDWFLACAFWITFYVGSPLIAFNVFTAFSIDVYCKLEELSEKGDEAKTEVETNLQKIQADMADGHGLCLHIQESAMLAKERVYQAMFEQEAPVEH